jgi:CHAT domain-containing protein
MSKSCRFHRMAQETTPQGNPTISILIDDPKTQTQTGGPISPSLTPHEINELWDDVRANTGIVQEATEDSTQDSSNPQGIRTGTRKQRVRTNEQDSDFTATDLKDIYAIVQDDAQFSEKDLENLDRYLPSKIVGSTRDHAQDCIRRGDTEGACEVLEIALRDLHEKLQEQEHANTDPWNVSVAEILIDQGRRQEARAVLSKVSDTTCSDQVASDKRLRADSSSTADAEYAKMMETTQVEAKLDIYCRAEDWDKVREVANELQEIEPIYFDLNKPMERFNQVRRIFHAGMLQEAEYKKAENNNDRNFHLTQALKIYNHGCYTSKVYNEFFDSNEAVVSGFDHSDCANIFFSAARICQIFDSMRYAIAPQWFSRKGLALTCLNWRDQALCFLEKGRARALLDSINRGCVVDNVRRRLIRKSVISVTEAARKAIKKRGSALSSAPSSRASSVSTGVPVSQLSALTTLDFKRRSHDRKRSDSGTQSERSTSRETFGSSLTLQTTDFSDLAISSVPPSPAVAVTPILTKEDYFHLRVRTNWRRCLLSVLTQGQIGTPKTVNELRANIPADAIVVEFALASRAPCGIMVIVATAEAVETVEWKETNTEEIRKCIGALRASMEISNDRMEQVRQDDTPHRVAVRPSDPKRQQSAFYQDRLDGLLRRFVVDPVKPFLEGKKNLIIVPSGDLAHVPWRLFFDLPITVVPSLEIWVRLRTQVNLRSPRKPELLAVSTAPEDPDKKKQRLPALRSIPFSRVEALYLAKSHDGVPFLADDQDHRALEASAKNIDILHICAHSNFDPDSPMSSALELFKDPLTIRDWHKLSIKAELVVFSSCLSGYSKAYDSGSTIGFAHTLLSTGTKAFIGSLWKVNDRATLLLMTMFYEELRKPLPPANALYEAQKRMRYLTQKDLTVVVARLERILLLKGKTSRYVVNVRSYIRALKETEVSEMRKPQYWAAFVLTGYGSKNLYPAGTEKAL